MIARVLAALLLGACGRVDFTAVADAASPDAAVDAVGGDAAPRSKRSDRRRRKLPVVAKAGPLDLRHTARMQRAYLLAVIAIAACYSPPSSDDVVGPFTGQVHRFAVDDFTFPMNNTQAREIGDDLDGDRHVDNQLGMVISTLGTQGLVTMHDDDIIGAGVVRSVVEIEADDLTFDDEVGVRYLGAEGAPAIVVGGRIEDELFIPNRTRTTRVPGRAVVHMPVFVEADPSPVELLAMEIELHPDGRGGFNAKVRGGVAFDDAMARAADAIFSMLRNNPGGHRQMRKLLDKNNDAEISVTEIEESSFLLALLSPDVELFDGSTRREMLSFGVGVHLAPCPSGHCAPPPVELCSDRARDGNESDVDCGGGTCLACPADAACTAPTDCQSGTCEQGRCTAPTCSDGVRNNFESDIDCGVGCAGCAEGRQCFETDDCASKECIGGRCTAP